MHSLKRISSIKVQLPRESGEDAVNLRIAELVAKSWSVGILQAAHVPAAEGSLALCPMVTSWCLLLFLALFSLGWGRGCGHVLLLFRCFYLSLCSGTRLAPVWVWGRTQCTHMSVFILGCAETSPRKVDTECPAIQMCTRPGSTSVCDCACAQAWPSCHLSISPSRAPPCSDLGCCPAVGITQKGQLRL